MFTPLPELDFPEDAGPAAYRDFIAALRRLLDGEPTNPQLLGVLEEQGHVPITQDNVALEAGRDRKAIAGKKSRYPLIAGYIKKLRSTHGVKPTTTALIQRLQEEAREWRHRERVLRSKLAEKVLELDAARREWTEARNESERWRQKAEGLGCVDSWDSH
jgi:hypothetical protein